MGDGEGGRWGGWWGVGWKNWRGSSTFGKKMQPVAVGEGGGADIAGVPGEAGGGIPVGVRRALLAVVVGRRICGHGWRRSIFVRVPPVGSAVYRRAVESGELLCSGSGRKICWPQ